MERETEKWNMEHFEIITTYVRQNSNFAQICNKKRKKEREEAEKEKKSTFEEGDVPYVSDHLLAFIQSNDPDQVFYQMAAFILINTGLRKTEVYFLRKEMLLYKTDEEVLKTNPHFRNFEGYIKVPFLLKTKT